jgi:hypothetical protein
MSRIGATPFFEPDANRDDQSKDAGHRLQLIAWNGAASPVASRFAPQATSGNSFHKNLAMKPGRRIFLRYLELSSAATAAPGA